MENKVFFPWAKPDFWGNEKEYLVQALESTWISGGAFVDRLESEFAQFCGSKFAVSSSNGTTSLHLAFVALGLSRGDEVIVPGFCFMAAPNVLLHMGAEPVFADVDPESYCVTAETIEPLITSRTRAIVPIHPYGNVSEMDEILDLGNRSQYPGDRGCSRIVCIQIQWQIYRNHGVDGLIQPTGGKDDHHWRRRDDHHR